MSTILVAGSAVDWSYFSAVRINEGISMPPAMTLYRDMDQSQQAGKDLATHIKEFLDKKIKVDVEGQEGKITLFSGTATRVGTLSTRGEDIAQELQTSHAGLQELNSYGTFSETERDLKSTPGLFWSQGKHSGDTLVIGGGHDGLEKLQRNRRCQIFENKSWDDIIKAVTKAHGLKVSGETGPAGPMKFVVQYQESDYNFVMRLLKEAGLVYACLEEGEFKLIQKYKPNESPGNKPEAIESYAAIKGRVLSLKSTVIAQDPADNKVKEGKYDGSSLKKPINSAGNVAGDFFETVPEVRDRFTPKSLDALAEQASGIGDQYAGLGLIKFRSIAVVRPGDLIKLEGAGSVHVQSVEHILESGMYSCVATAVLADLPYHIPQQPHIPRIYGPQTAQVVSNKDPEKRDLRVQVQFHWPDLAAKAKPQAWIRVVQPWAGAEHGAQFVPQVGDEVVVEFMNGDPNFPLITGSVYNGKQKVFYPEHAEEKLTTTAIKTRSNELKIDDAKDKEIVEITAKKSFHTFANDQKANIQADDKQINIQHKEKPINITADSDAITVKATQKTIVVEAGTSITLKVGDNQIVIDTKGITIKGMKSTLDSTAGTTVQSTATTTVKGTMVQIN